MEPLEEHRHEIRPEVRVHESGAWAVLRVAMCQVGLDSTPLANGCVVDDEPMAPAAAPKGRAVPVRLAEGSQLRLSRESLVALRQRCPALQGSWGLFGARGGPLSKVSMPIFRMLLHWAKTGRLVFPHERVAELLAALQVMRAEGSEQRAGLRKGLSRLESRSREGR